MADSLGSELGTGLRHTQSVLLMCVVDKKTIYDFVL